MELSFERRNIGAFDNTSYNDEIPLPPDMCRRQQHFHGYLQPCDRSRKGISSNNDYLIVQGSIRSSSKEFSDFQFGNYQIYRGRENQYRNKHEFHDLAEFSIYSEIADSRINPLRSHCKTTQSGVKDLARTAYVQSPLENYKQKDAKTSKKTSQNASCLRCKMVILLMIVAIMIIALGFGIYFLIRQNIGEENKTLQNADVHKGTKENSDENPTSSVTSTRIKTMENSTPFTTPIDNEILSTKVPLPNTIVTSSTNVSSMTFTFPASSLTPPKDQDVSPEKEITSTQATISTTQTYCSPTGNAILQLNPHQIADLQDHRDLFLHSCEADIGYPAGDLSVEMMKSEDLEFKQIDVTIINSTEDRTACEIHRTIMFGTVFSLDMDKAIVRCKVTNENFPDYPDLYSNNKTVSLIPGDACQGNTVSRSLRVHPTNCQYYIECQNNIPYGRSCQPNHCFGIYSTDVCQPCSQVECPTAGGICTNTTIVQQQNKVNMTLHADQIIGLTSPRTSNLHTCTDNVGNPPGDITVEIQLVGDDNYQPISPTYELKTDTTENCGITRVLKFWIGFTVSMLNATIRCKVTRNLNPDNTPIYSNPEMLSLVSNDFCNRNYNGTNRYHHSTDCNRFVTCMEKEPFVHACPSGLCFSLEKNYCDYCSEVKTCP